MNEPQNSKIKDLPVSLFDFSMNNAPLMYFNMRKQSIITQKGKREVSKIHNCKKYRVAIVTKPITHNYDQ